MSRMHTMACETNARAAAPGTRITCLCGGVAELTERDLPTAAPRIFGREMAVTPDGWDIVLGPLRFEIRDKQPFMAPRCITWLANGHPFTGTKEQCAAALELYLTSIHNALVQAGSEPSDFAAPLTFARRGPLR